MGKERGPAPDPKPGDLVDQRYSLIREVAVGGMGIVFEARADGGRVMVAVKLLHAGYQYREDVRQRLLREARALELARHPSVVRFIDAGTCARHGVFLVTEMLQGRPLDGLLAARDRLPIPDTVSIGVQVAEALGHSHARGVVHRDVKPSNVFVARGAGGEETIRLLDFGIARIPGDEVAGASKLTKMGDVIGTLDYMAPEQLLGQDVREPTCDVYGLGATLYECLTGAAPRTGAYEARLIELLSKKAPPIDVRARRPETPPELARAIERALSDDASRRQPDCRTLAAEIIGAVFTPRAAMASTLLGRASLPAPTAPHVPRSESAIPLELKPAAMAAPIPLAKRRDKTEEPIPLAASRRKHPRAPYVTPVRIHPVSGRTFTGRTEDISEGGVLVLAGGPIADGDTVRLDLALPVTGHLLELSAVAKWVHDARGNRRAVGLSFVKLPKGAAATIRSYVERSEA